MTTQEEADRHLETDHLMSDLHGRSVRGGMVTLAGQAAQFALQMVATMVLARMLTPADYGLVGMVTVLTGFISMFADMGLSQATVQRSQVTQGEISALFWLNVAVSVLLALVTAALAPALAWFYGDPRLVSVTVAMGGCFLFSGLAAQHGALLRRQMRFAAVAVVDLTTLIAGILVGITLAALGAHYWAIVAQYAAASVTQAIMVWLLSGWRPGRATFTSGVRSMARFGTNLIGFSVFNYFARNADNFLIGWRWGAAQLGFYSKAYGLLMLPLKQINTPVSSVAVAMLSRLQNQPERYRRAYHLAIDALNFVTMPGIAFLIVTADWIVPLILGPQWTQASRVFRYLGICGLVQPLCNSTGWLFISQGRTGDMARWGMIGGTLITLSFVAGLHWGPVGVAIAYSTCMVFVVCPLLFYLVGKHGPVSTRSLHRALVLPMFAVLCVIAALGALRFWSGITDPRIGLSLALPLTVVAALACYMSVAPGRRVLIELLAMLPRRTPHPATRAL